MKLRLNLCKRGFLRRGCYKGGPFRLNYWPLWSQKIKVLVLKISDSAPGETRFLHLNDLLLFTPLIPQASPADLLGNEKKRKANSVHRFSNRQTRESPRAMREGACFLNPVKFFYEPSKQPKVPSHVDLVTQGAYVLLTSSSNGFPDTASQIPCPCLSTCLTEPWEGECNLFNNSQCPPYSPLSTQCFPSYFQISLRPQERTQ